MTFQARSMTGVSMAISPGIALRQFPDAKNVDAKTMSGLRVPTPPCPPLSNGGKETRPLGTGGKEIHPRSKGGKEIRALSKGGKEILWRTAACDKKDDGRWHLRSDQRQFLAGP